MNYKKVLAKTKVFWLSFVLTRMLYELKNVSKYEYKSRTISAILLFPISSFLCIYLELSF